jgi:flagellin
MTISVQTNASAIIALQNLNKTAGDLQSAQNTISTGMMINTAKDNASVWSIAQKQRADVGALGAVQASLNRASSIADVAQTAGASISDLLNQVKQKVVAAQDPSLDPTSRAAYNTDFQSLLRQIQDVVNNAVFDGANILDGSLTGNISFLANADATSFITLSTQNLTLGGSIINIAATATIGTVTAAQGVLSQINSSINKVNSALGDIGAQATEIQNHATFVAKLSDVLNQGIGNLVDADMAKESAQLQALQAQQQLGVEALSIANSAPQIVLQLFK